VIHAQTPDGAKDLILRGWKGPRGLKGFTQGRITTPAGDKKIWDGTVSTSLVITASPMQVLGAGFVAPGGSVSAQTDSTQASASSSDGTGPFAYVWTKTYDDGAGGTWTITNPNSSSTTFWASAVSSQSYATFRCTVTDARGATGTVDVQASVRAYSGGM
jgi:hypothetical protein